MPADRKKMGDLHEEFLKELFGGHQARGSGNQWRDPADGRNSHMTEPLAFAWDGKSTRGESVAITREMLRKIIAQAGPERPVIGVRFYDNDRLDRIGLDWILSQATDFAELLELARNPGEDPEVIQLMHDDIQALLGALGKVTTPGRPAHEIMQDLIAEVARLREESERRERLLAHMTEAARPSPQENVRLLMGCTDEELTDALHFLGPDKRARLRAFLAGEKSQSPLPPEPAPPVLDTTIIFSLHTNDERRMVHQGVHISSTGARRTFPVGTVRVERTMDDKDRLIVNECLVRRGELWQDGVLIVRTGILDNATVT